MKPVYLFLLLLLALSGCASGPKYDTARYSRALTPSQAVAEQDALRGSPVLWGGVIIASRNLAEVSELEILAYPLDGQQRPLTAEPPLGRIIARRTGYLETVDYAAGRSVTLAGTLAGTQEGKLGEASYTYPVLMIDQLYLWPEGGEGQTRFHFGIGVMIRN